MRLAGTTVRFKKSEIEGENAHTANRFAPEEAFDCVLPRPVDGDEESPGPPTGQRRKARKMTLHPRAMKVQAAEIELNQFLLDWAERHELTWCEMARALTERTQVCLKYILRTERQPKIQAKS